MLNVAAQPDSAPPTINGGGRDLWRALVIDGRQVVWSRASTGPRTLTYALARQARHNDDAVNCPAIGPFERLTESSRLSRDQLRAAAAAAFARWESVSTLEFREVDSDAQADILIGEQLEPDGYAFTNLDLGPELSGGSRAIRKAEICLNPQRRWKIGFDGNLAAYDLVHTLTHEIGHAIGLDHPSARGHVMSFRYDEQHAALTDGDVLGIVALYGSHPSRRR